MTVPTRAPRVIRAATPPRQGTEPDERATLWELRREGTSPLRADLVGMMDGVEVELFRGLTFRRRWRFLTDAGARAYAERVRVRLERRGFRERRTDGRTRTWPQ